MRAVQVDLMASTDEAPRLTSLSHGAGCACKIAAQELELIRDALPLSADPNLIVGLDPADDATVYRLNDDLAIVQSVDFFTPIVDDPYDFGRIAAANALSDIYAMGAEPILALNIVAFNLGDLGHELLTAILLGAAEVAGQAGVAVAGGHSIDDPEPKYGMAVTGRAHPDEIITAAGANPGDQLFLTKPLGGGLVTTAAKRGRAMHEVIAAATEVMVELNRDAARAARDAQATAMTDVTGFGLLGHLHELSAASGVTARVEAAAVPAIDGVGKLAGEPDCVAGGSRRNAAHAERFTEWAPSVLAESRVLLTDAMTSGGLLVAVPPDDASSMRGTHIGVLRSGEPGSIHVV